MLDQLVESKSNAKENSKRSGFMLTTMIIAVALLLGGWVYSLFAQDYGMGADDLELSTLVAPVPVPENEPPPPPEPEDQPEKKQNQQTDQNVDIRKEIIKNIFESPSDIDKINTEKTDAKARRLGRITQIGERDSNAQGAPTGATRTVPTDGGGGSITQNVPDPEPDPPADDPPPPPPPKPTPKPVPKTISGGVVNGKATSLPKPAYPASARAVGAKGSVSVQVLIDENGRVVSASAVSGHPLLKGPAVAAARRARFAPTKLSGQPVKVSGVITYVFN